MSALYHLDQSNNRVVMYTADRETSAEGLQLIQTLGHRILVFLFPVCPVLSAHKNTCTAALRAPGGIKDQGSQQDEHRVFNSLLYYLCVLAVCIRSVAAGTSCALLPRMRPSTPTWSTCSAHRDA